MSDLAMQIMDHFKLNQDKRYKGYQLARIFKVLPKEITAAMQGLSIETAVEGKDRVYFVISDDAKSRTVKHGVALCSIEKPKQDKRAMAIAMERCRELYPNGANFKSIS